MYIYMCLAEVFTPLHFFTFYYVAALCQTALN